MRERKPGSQVENEKQSSNKIKKTIIGWREKWEERERNGTRGDIKKEHLLFLQEQQITFMKNFYKNKKKNKYKKASSEIKKISL